MNRSVISRRIPAFDGREICISDIHGDYHALRALLEKVNYKPGQDRLMLLGDLMEKGGPNLKLVRFLMELSKQEHVFILMGNCDFVAKNVLFSYRLDFLLEQLLSRPNSLIHEMVKEAGLEAVDEQTDMDVLAYELRRRYLKELCFLNDLPQVLESPERIYTHAGLLNETTYASDFKYVLTYPLFGNTEQRFQKAVVCGHMPVTEYCKTKASFTPRYHAASNIYSIDGGNQVKKGGQLNALMFEGSSVSSESVDFLPQVKVLKSTHPQNLSPFFITFNKGQLNVLEERSGQILAYSPYLNRRFWMDSSFYVDGKGTDFTNYEMPLAKGETVKLVQTYGNKAQIKKNSVLGWTDLDNLDWKGTRNTMRLCFDCDDTLYNLAWPYLTTLHQFFPDLDESIDLEQMYQDYRGFGDALFDLLQEGTITPDDSGILRIVKVCQKYNLDLNVLDAWRFQETYRQNQYKAKMSPQMESFLASFQGDLAILTNGQDAHQRAKIKSLRADQLVSPSHIFTSQQLGYRKPDPRAFQEAFQRMNEDLQKWYYIGDSYENDMEGAKSAGMKTIHLNRHHQKSGPCADYEVFTEDELFELLNKLQNEQDNETEKNR